MNNELRHHRNKTAITDDCLDNDRFTPPDLDLLNLRLSDESKRSLRDKSPNLGRYSSSRHRENLRSSRLFFGEAGSKPHQHRNIQENIFHSKQESSSPQKQNTGCQRFKCPHTIYVPSGNDFPTGTERVNNVKDYRCSDLRNSCPRRGPSLFDRRMEFLHSDKGKTEGDEAHQKKTSSDFPFTQTPSGYFKILPDQVVFSSKKVSVLVADPAKTKVNIQKELEDTKLKGIMPPIPSKLFQQPHNIRADTSELFTKMRQTEIASDCEETDGEGLESLKPEMKLERLGYTNNGPIDYSKLALPTKTNLYHELFRRISNYVNTDTQVVIGQDEFSCHAMVLQAYSEFFEKNQNTSRIELPQNEVSVNAFVTIYDWMITGKECVTLLKRDNILEIFVASRYLAIKELEEQCWAFLDSEDIFTEDTAFMLYVEARKLQIPEVKELMIPRIRNFFLMLVSSQDFIELDIDEVCVLLSSNYIAINCEMEVLMSAVRWLKADWDNRLQHLVKIMSCVRFGLIAPWQLVDIKRNPENPELLEIVSVPDVTKMVDDGLSFVIIKYWYGHQSDDYAHWIELLGLSEPQERNWVGAEKNYVTYRQFVAFLDAYRRDNLLERSKIKPKKETEPPSVHACFPPADLASMASTGKEFISLPPKSFNLKSPLLKNHEYCTSEDSRSPTSGTRSLTEDEAATTIQSAYRNYRTRKFIKHHISPFPTVCVPANMRKPLSKSKSKTAITSQNFKVLSMFATHNPSPEKPEQKKTEPTSVCPVNTVNSKFLIKGSLFSHDRESVLVFGGMDPHTSYGVNRNTGKDIYRYLPETNCWDYVGELPEPRQHHSTAFFRGRVYLAGGANPISDEAKDKAVVVNTVWSYDPVSRTWYKEAAMITPRKNFGLVVSHMKLYAIGGQDKNGRMLASVERFESGGIWEEVAPLKSPRMGMACAKYRDCIWVAGGMCGSKRNPLTNTVECYDTRKNEWTRIENLRFPRCFACLFAMNDKLYLIGGAGRLSEKDRNTASVAAIDIWDPNDKEWKLKTELAIPRHGHSVAYLGTQILIIGGVTTVYMRALSNTECYCCERLTWVRGISPLPTTLSGHSSVTLPPASLM